MKTMFRILRNVLLGIVVAYLAAASYMYINQRSFVFKPSGELQTPEHKGLSNVTVQQVEMADGTNVSVWYAPPQNASAATVLYFHGNSGNVSGRSARFKQILDSGFGLYAPSYRGYAGSDGSPSERGFVSDALEHFDKLSEKTENIILHGESLGTGVATAVASKRAGAKLLVLEAPYTALVDMAKEQYAWLPVDFLMKDQMKTRLRIQQVQAPVLIVHGTEDVVIPVEHGKRLFELAPSPRTLKVIEGAEHSDLWTSGLWGLVLEQLKPQSEQ